MTKIIKFRAWDGLNKKFSYWTMNDLCTYAEKEEKPSALDDWQQNTGTMDKNGQEIYEGDVLHITTKDLVNLNYKLVVEWNPEGFWKGFRDFSMAKIIGNIHENSDLIN